MNKKLLSALLAALMLASSLVACADKEDTDKKETLGSAVSEAPADTPEFEDRDFDGEEFKFLIYGSTATDFTDNYIWADGVTGGTVPDAVMERNRKVEEKYDVTITAEECGPIGEAVKRMQAGQCDFEVIYEWGIRTTGAAFDGMLYDFLDLDHISLNSSYWVTGAADKLTIGDHLYINTNFITMNPLSWAGGKLFNKNMMAELNYEEPYSYVYNNNWTFDVYMDMVFGATADLNGDGKMTVDDRYGSFGSDGGLVSDIVGSVAPDLVKDNGDGTYSVQLYNEAMVATYQKYANTVKTHEDSFLDFEDVWNSGADLSGFSSKHVGGRFVAFGEGHCLFLGASIDMTKEFENMDDTYGIVPNPVLNPGDEFSSGVDYCAPMFSLPIQLTDEEADMVGVILEYMAYESEQIVLPAYYTTTVKTQRMEAQEDYDMLDIIRNNIEYSWTGLYLSGDITSVRGEMYAAGHFNSVARRMESKCQAELDETVEKLYNIDNMK